MNIKIQVLEHGYSLVRATAGASAFDIRNPSEEVYLRKGKSVKVPLGIKSAIPEGMLAIMEPRSGSGSRGVRLMNTVGYIDTDYRGEWIAVLTLDPAAKEEVTFKRGDRMLQVAFVHTSTDITYTSELDETERGEGGFGSTGEE